MRSMNYAIKNTTVKLGAMVVSLLAGTVLVLSTSLASASGENKVMDEKAKVEMIKVEKNKVEKVMLKEKKAEEEMVVKQKAHSDLGVLDEGILGLRFGEDILGEGILGIEE